MNGPIRTVPIFFLVAAMSGCKPTFKQSGSIRVDGAPFQPIACHVLTRCQGIELINEVADRLELTLPPARLEAWRELKGTPGLRYLPGAGKTPVDLGTCGSLTLTGEGYHEPRGRAASGSISLSCSGAVTVRGDLEFSGCF